MTSFWLQTWRIDAISLISMVVAIGSYSMTARRHAHAAPFSSPESYSGC